MYTGASPYLSAPADLSALSDRKRERPSLDRANTTGTSSFARQREREQALGEEFPILGDLYKTKKLLASLQGWIAANADVLGLSSGAKVLQLKELLTKAEGFLWEAAEKLGVSEHNPEIQRVEPMPTFDESNAQTLAVEVRMLLSEQTRLLRAIIAKVEHDVEADHSAASPKTPSRGQREHGRGLAVPLLQQNRSSRRRAGMPKRAIEQAFLTMQLMAAAVRNELHVAPIAAQRVAAQAAREMETRMSDLRASVNAVLAPPPRPAQPPLVVAVEPDPEPEAAAGPPGSRPASPEPEPEEEEEEEAWGGEGEGEASGGDGWERSPAKKRAARRRQGPIVKMPSRFVSGARLLAAQGGKLPDWMHMEVRKPRPRPPPPAPAPAPAPPRPRLRPGAGAGASRRGLAHPAPRPRAPAPATHPPAPHYELPRPEPAAAMPVAGPARGRQAVPMFTLSPDAVPEPVQRQLPSWVTPRGPPLRALGVPPPHRLAHMPVAALGPAVAGKGGGLLPAIPPPGFRQAFH
eukprot:tig00000711_g3378.t1